MIDQCLSASTKLADLSSVLGSGLGLYLALAIIQTVGSVGVMRLRRRARYLREAIWLNELHTLRASIWNVEAELSRVELSLETLSSRLFVFTFVLILVSLGGIGMAALNPSLILGCGAVYAIIVFYLILPPAIFLLASLIIRVRSRSALSAVLSCENKVLEALSGEG